VAKSNGITTSPTPASSLNPSSPSLATIRPTESRPGAHTITISVPGHPRRQSRLFHLLSIPLQCQHLLRILIDTHNTSWFTRLRHALIHTHFLLLATATPTIIFHFVFPQRLTQRPPQSPPTSTLSFSSQLNPKKTLNVLRGADLIQGIEWTFIARNHST